MKIIQIFSLICYGIFWYLLLHIIVNLGGVMGLIPLTGVPLPFLSYGGSYNLCLIVSLFIVHRVNIENKIEKGKNLMFLLLYTKREHIKY